MDKLNRGDKIYLDKEQTKESAVNTFLASRDRIVECYEYNDTSGYGSKTRLFLCEDYKHECMAIIRQVWNDFDKIWMEEEMSFDSDSFTFLSSLIKGESNCLGGEYTLVSET